ncbi:MAG: HAD-IIIA family hydrolase [Candidatus Eisenbacteria bacterium]|uniref:HAD-IIIA family hydrolase n=1 Tax=Eiseniibacteriota bacterium TaxID=2212470 RepID=A0A538U434_UNCEI|nr:MAG: HAD-IIIA family hydrolase [Candidatus Eisenbacteria bacterium]
MIRAIIFDLDNTLTDFMKMKEEAIGAAIDGMIDAGLELPREAVRARIDAIYQEQGLEFQQVFDALLEREFGRVDPKILASGIVAYRRARGSWLKPYPHVQLALLELTKRGIRLAVVSDAPRAQAWLRLCDLSLQHVFDVVVTFDDTRERKPSPAPFREALRQLDVTAAETLMVGDWPERDVVGAKSLGMKTVFARYGDTFGTRESGADFEIDDVLELVTIVDGLNDAADPSAPGKAQPQEA